MRVVSPFRPFVPESQAHLRLGPFDWVEALRMLRVSVQQACGCETWAITDVDTDLPVPAFQYRTTHRRLMLWIVEIALRYLESSDFDQPTWMISPDVLVMRDLAPYGDADLGVVVRLQQKYVAAGRPLLNSLQFWHPRAQDRLVAFYRRALALAETLSEDAIQWGADTMPLVELLSPLQLGLFERAGLMVRGLDGAEMQRCPTTVEIKYLAQGMPVQRPLPACVDFKYRHKAHMRGFFRALVATEVPA